MLVEGDAATFEDTVADVRRAGWDLVGGFGGPVGVTEVRYGPVGSTADAAAALLAVLAGAGAVMHVRATADVLDRLLDDLRHVRRVRHVRGVGVRRQSPLSPPALDADAVAILTVLAEGGTLGDAARALGLSRRTADRRLAAARRALGVERTVEAVARARRHGCLR